MNKLILSLVALFVLANAPVAMADEDTTPIWTAQEVSDLQQSTKNASEAGEGNEAALDWGYVYYCEAQSYVSGAWYYWYSYNLGLARYNALAACVANNGYTCNVACR